MLGKHKTIFLCLISIATLNTCSSGLRPVTDYSRLDNKLGYCIYSGVDGPGNFDDKAIKFILKTSLNGYTYVFGQIKKDNHELFENPLLLSHNFSEQEITNYSNIINRALQQTGFIWLSGNFEAKSTDDKSINRIIDCGWYISSQPAQKIILVSQFYDSFALDNGKTFVFESETGVLLGIINLNYHQDFSKLKKGEFQFPSQDDIKKCLEDYNSVKESLTTAQNLYQDGKYKEAANIYEKIAEKTPFDIPKSLIHWELSTIYRRMLDLTEGHFKENKNLATIDISSISKIEHGSESSLVTGDGELSILEPQKGSYFMGLIDHKLSSFSFSAEMQLVDIEGKATESKEFGIVIKKEMPLQYILVLLNKKGFFRIVQIEGSKWKTLHPSTWTYLYDGINQVNRLNLSQANDFIGIYLNERYLYSLPQGQAGTFNVGFYVDSNIQIKIRDLSLCNSNESIEKVIYHLCKFAGIVERYLRTSADESFGLVDKLLLAERIIEERFKNPLPYFVNMGNIYLGENKFAEAAEKFSKALEYSDDPEERSMIQLLLAKSYHFANNCENEKKVLLDFIIEIESVKEREHYLEDITFAKDRLKFLEK